MRGLPRRLNERLGFIHVRVCRGLPLDRRGCLAVLHAYVVGKIQIYAPRMSLTRTRRAVPVCPAGTYSSSGSTSCIGTCLPTWCFAARNVKRFFLFNLAGVTTTSVSCGLVQRCWGSGMHGVPIVQQQ
jgi:hypothetical protein